MSPIEPDTRDWAEVLDIGCAQCGFTGDEDVIELRVRIAEAPASWSPVLTRADAADRPREDRWSAVEYAAHLRDVLTEFRGRTLLMLAEEAPTLPNFDGDAVALESDYRNQPAAEVLAGLEEAAAAYAGSLAALEDGQWQRTGLRADGREFTIASLTRYGWHEVHHHLGDVEG
ncbi:MULTISPECIES: DinB family protein [unclassified Brevibacterium]|uniref:DinB family protein n=1 Tax=unclassified Brevibacterium TaxID=2614124 RepID=UPI0010918D6E|nr:DinB family protein [Brevibacterium sp. S22]TGD32712.1 DinB family protein [Brevibacterium sp. S22]